jgi:hypothetical protein
VIEAFVERTMGGASRPFGLTPDLFVIAGFGIAGAFFTIRDVRALAAAVAVLLAFRGAVAASIARRAGTAPWRRAAITVANIGAEGALIGAAAAWSRSHTNLAAPLAVGFLAFGGVLLLSYARIRIRASAGIDLADGPWGIAAREVRLLVLAAGILIGQAYWALVIIAALTNASVLGHLVRLRRDLSE